MEKAKKAATQKRNPMKPATERIRALSEGLRSELERWSGVTLKRAFGMTLAYRGKAVFAAFPDTKAIYHEDAIMLKFAEEKPALVNRMATDSHFISAAMATGTKSRSEGRKWRFFLIRDDSDVHAALEWLAEAYELAHAAKPRGKSLRAQAKSKL